MLPLAKTEYDDVSDAQLLNDQVQETAGTFALDVDALSPSDASSLQRAAATMHDACAKSLVNWQRAIGDIRDSLQAEQNGTYASDSNSEQYYGNSEIAQVSCNRAILAFNAAVGHANTSIKSAYAGATAAIHKF